MEFLTFHVEGQAIVEDLKTIKVRGSLISSLDVARYNCSLHRFFSDVSNSSDKRSELKGIVTFNCLNLLFFQFFSFDYSCFMIVLFKPDFNDNGNSSH